MNISKTTTKFAEARGLSVYIDEDTSILWIGVNNENIGEDICAYIANENGTFTWMGNVWLPRDTKEELPATIRDEKHLREVIDFISKDAAVIEELAA
jgi:hypothetical protein